jgi:predicted GNAT superfamily acetyltransferase
MILDLQGNPIKSDALAEKEAVDETTQKLGKEATKLIRALGNRGYRVCLFAANKDGVVVSNNIQTKDPTKLKDFLKAMIDINL